MRPSVKYIWLLTRMYLEVAVWVGALVWLAFSTTDFSGHHAEVCPFRSLGWTFCPGCGLGRSIILFFHGRLAESFQMHPLGIPAVIIFVYRIVTLLKKNRQILRYLRPSNPPNHDTPFV